MSGLLLITEDRLIISEQCEMKWHRVSGRPYHPNTRIISLSAILLRKTSWFRGSGCNYVYKCPGSVQLTTCVCVCSLSRCSSLSTHTCPLSSSARQPSITQFVEWARCFSSCIRLSTTTGPWTLPTAAASRPRGSVSGCVIFEFLSPPRRGQAEVICYLYAVEYDSIRFGLLFFINRFPSVRMLTRVKLIVSEKEIKGCEPITVVVCKSAKACNQSVFLKWQQLPPRTHTHTHLKWLISTWKCRCLSAVRTVAITGDDSEADTPHQYCHLDRALGVGVGPLKPGPIAWLASSVCGTTVCHQAGCSGGSECPWTVVAFFTFFIV